MKIKKSCIRFLWVLGLCLLPLQAWSAPFPALTGTVNINTATPSELTLLPGIGPVKAAQIVALRQKGPFQSWEDLKKIRGLGAKRLEALRPHVRFTGPTTAKRSATPAPETQATVQPAP